MAFIWMKSLRPQESTSFIRLRPWITSSITSCRRLLRWARPFPLLILIATAGQISISPTVVKAAKTALYRNLGNGSFKRCGREMGLADVNQASTGVSMGAVWGDYDNDGYEDLFLYKWGRPELFHNDAGRTFTRVTRKAGLPRVGKRQHRHLV